MTRLKGHVRLAALVAVVAMLGVVGCKKVSPEEAALLAAKGYYTHLAKGEYQQFLEGKAGSDSLPDDYREQLLVAYAQFADRQQREHGGISEVQANTASTDSLLHCTNAFLILCYGDSTQEEIVVPMVEHDGRWRMK